MRKHTLSSRRALASVFLLCAFGAGAASAQAGDGQTGGARQAQRPAPQPTHAPAAAARDSEVACGGFIEQTSQAAAGQLVGGVEEAQRRMFGQGELVFIDAGTRVGQEFAVVRPRGRFSSKFSRKGTLGVFTQEIGRVRVVRVRGGVSVAEVTLACTDLLLGDLLRPYVPAAVPAGREEGSLDIFAEPTGKQTGRIVMARDGREVVTRDDVVYVDLGAEDNLTAGDRLTVFRPEGHGTIVDYGEEINANSRRDYQSDEFRGGGFSNQAQRVRDLDGPKSGPSVKTPDIKRRRPPVPRHVVGELVVLRVEGRTATAVVTRTVQEIHNGDSVEVQ